MKVYVHIAVYLLHLLLCIAASAVEAKLKPDDKSAGAANTGEIVRLLSGDDKITCKAGNFYFDRIDTPIKVGMPEVEGCGARAYELPIGEPNLTGRITRFISVNGDSVLRLRGAGSSWKGIEFRGGDNRPATLVEVEGRGTPATGRHIFRDCGFVEGTVAIRSLAGFYGLEGFVKDENHADNCSVENAICVGCDVFFKSENQQSVYWNFDGLDVNSYHDERPTVIFDLVRGGHVRASNIAANHPWTTLFRVWGGAGYSPWTNRLTVSEVSWDRPVPVVHKNPYFTLFEYVKPDETNRWWEKWQLRVTGQLNIEGERFDRAKLIKVPRWYDQSGLKYELGGVN